MALSVFPAPSAGGIKSVQRGSAAGAGTVTITAVDTSKSFVNVFGTTSTGTVAATGNINAMNGTLNGYNGTLSAQSGSNSQASINSGNNNPQISGIYVGGTPSGNWGGTNVAAGTINTNAQNVGFNAKTLSTNATTLTGSSNNLVSGVVQGYLSGSTSLEVSGACRWEVVEFN